VAKPGRIVVTGTVRSEALDQYQWKRTGRQDRIVLLDQLVEQFMSIEPCRSAQRMFVVVDNGWSNCQMLWIWQ